jgi:tetratricopeptide (TPR) repeat protein
LCLLTLAGFFPVVDHQFVIEGDTVYVTANPAVRAGFTRRGIAWAFTTTHAGNWHPLTWLSHMLDVEIDELNPRGHHLTNLVLHAANVLLLFLVLSWMTRPSSALGSDPSTGRPTQLPDAKSLWTSAFVAALFAIHPLHVEPVAWVAQRKELLAGLFWMLTMGAYVAYTRKPSVARYALVLAAFVPGLMSKPVLVTLPFVLLLLDYWPLGRLASRTQDRPTTGRLVLEKLPLAALSAAACVVTLLVQQREGTVEAAATVPFSARAGGALLAYVGYLTKTLWPTGLAWYYPHFATTGQLTVGGAFGAAFLLAAITVAVTVLRNERRYLLVGWLWFLGTLVPMIGLVSIGSHAMADRYTYVPSIGLFLMAAWTIADCGLDWKRHRVALAIGAACLLGLSLIATWFQLRHWRDSVALFRHAVAVAPSDLAHANLGIVLSQLGREQLMQAGLHQGERRDVLAREGKSTLEEAVEHHRAALERHFDSPTVRHSLGNTLSRLGQYEQAVEHYEAALRMRPDAGDVHNNLGSALAALGRLDEAADHFEEAVRLRPADVIGHVNLANLFEKQGRSEAAIEHYIEVIRLLPTDAVAHNSVALLLSRQGKGREAIAHYREAMRLRPDYGEVRNNLAWTLATSAEDPLRDGVEAVELAEQTSRETKYLHPAALDTLAAAYAEAGRFDDAVRVAEQAAQLARADGQLEIALGIEGRLKLYREAKPYREVPAAP